MSSPSNQDGILPALISLDHGFLCILIEYTRAQNRSILAVSSLYSPSTRTMNYLWVFSRRSRLLSPGLLHKWRILTQKADTSPKGGLITLFSYLSMTGKRCYNTKVHICASNSKSFVICGAMFLGLRTLSECDGFACDIVVQIGTGRLGIV